MKEEETVIGVSDVDGRRGISCLPRVTIPKEKSHDSLQTRELIRSEDKREGKDQLRDIGKLSKDRTPESKELANILKSL
jgi:hypothetical protein